MREGLKGTELIVARGNGSKTWRDSSRSAKPEKASTAVTSLDSLTESPGTREG
jgi:hypothetical protein